MRKAASVFCVLLCFASAALSEAKLHQALWPPAKTQESQSGDFLRFNLYKHNGGPASNTLLVIGGVHGDEPGGYFAASLLATHYRITKGSLWVVPNLNFESIIKNRRGIYGDMNRKFAKVEKNDPDYASVQRIKEVVLDPRVDLVINLHDGHGFYRERWENYIFNPRAWGQTFVIDQKTLAQAKFGNMDEIAKRISEKLNGNLAEDHHFFSIKNTETRYKDEEMQRSLTYFAVTNLKPAFGQETSKNIDALAVKVEYHLRSIEEFMKLMDIEFERSFELNFEGIQQALSGYGSLSINGHITLNLLDLRSVLRFVPMADEGNRFEFEHPLGAVKRVDNRYDLFIGNKHISSLYPQIFKLDCNNTEAVFVVDGVRKTVKMGETIEVARSFRVDKEVPMRVNVIGFSKPGVESEEDIDISAADMIRGFSQDVRAATYRVEFYSNGAFCGMVNVRFR
ncbi:MAG: M99 family carboxypeptidase catalytic domain-containing protein [Campylobacterales bacterium]